MIFRLAFPLTAGLIFGRPKEPDQGREFIICRGVYYFGFGLYWGLLAKKKDHRKALKANTKTDRLARIVLTTATGKGIEVQGSKPPALTPDLP